MEPKSIGPYRLVCRLGVGGMAEVFLASHEPMPGSERLVAVKRILANLVQNRSFLNMFLDEARVLSRLYHPNLDRVIDAGEHQGVPYIVLDYIPGRDLGVALSSHEKRSRLPLDVSVHIASRVAAGLAHAHGLTDENGDCLGIVHRDVSPENIIITFEGTVKVVDFGVARGTMRATETAPGLIKGKPSFMAPEQILARQVDHKADIFALGVLVYRLTTGRHPFGVDGDDAATFRRLLEVVPTPPHLLVGDYPRTLSAVVMKALDREPHRRHSTADGFLADLEGVMREEGWLPSDRKLARLMGELFPAAAAAARRLSSQPRDQEAARQASYLTRGDLRMQSGFEDDEDTEMATAPDEPTRRDDLSSVASSPRRPKEPTGGRRAIPLGMSAGSEMDTVTEQSGTTPADMDSVTAPDRPSALDMRRKAEEPVPQPGSQEQLKESGARSPWRHPAETLPRPLGSATEGSRPSACATPAATKEPLEDDPSRDARLDEAGPRARPAPRLAKDLPPPPLDSRLLADPEETSESPMSGMSTHPGRSWRTPREHTEHEDDTAVHARPSPGRERAPPKPTSSSRDEGEGSRVERHQDSGPPPWRTPAGIVLTTAVCVVVLTAIVLSVCGG